MKIIKRKEEKEEVKLKKKKNNETALTLIPVQFSIMIGK